MTRKILAATFFLLAAVLLGCAGVMTRQVTDALTDNMIKMMKAQAEIEREKRQERYHVEGEIASLQMKEIEVEDPDPAKIKRTEEPTEKGVNIKVESGRKKIKICVVTFKDGREEEFRNVPTQPLDAGIYYFIEYNGMNEVTSVSKKQK